MDAKVQGHVIIGNRAYYSFAKQGTLKQGIIGGLENEWEEIGGKED